MKKIEKILKWTFWEKEIKVDIYQNFWNKNLVLNIHWVYSSKNDKVQKRFAEKIWKNNDANIILFSSSRKNIDFDKNLTEKENLLKKFCWKTFLEELKDSKIVLKDILENSKKYFWVEKKDLNIIINWNSLWGTIAFFLAFEFPEIKNISTVWTWFRKQKWETPIIDTFPLLEEYKKVLRNFSWKYLLNESGNDNKFSTESFSEFFENIQAKEKKRIFYPWVNHPFSELFWENSEKPYDEVYKNFVNYFLK